MGNSSTSEDQDARQGQLLRQEPEPGHGKVVVDRKVVPPEIVRRAEGALSAYCEQTGRSLRPWRGRGGPSEALKRIICRLLDFPEVEEEQLAAVIRNVLSNPPTWVEGTPDVGDIFGPRAFERALSNNGTPAPRRSAAQQEDDRIRERLEAAGIGG